MDSVEHQDDVGEPVTRPAVQPQTQLPTVTRRDAVWRAAEANRVHYGAAHRMEELKVALLRAENEASELRTRLNAFETSTFWGLTRPLRRVVQMAKALRGVQDTIDDLPSPPFPPADPASGAGYQAWIADEEPAILATLVRPGAGPIAVAAPRLGLVLWTAERVGGLVAQALTATLVHIPTDCLVMVVCPFSALTAARQAAAATGRTEILFQAGIAAYESLARALDQLGADYLCFHNLSDQIARRALGVVRAVLREQPQTTLLFADEDWLSPDGARIRPFFKPGWDVELQRGQDLIGPFAFYATRALRDVDLTGLAGPAWLYDLASRVAAAALPERIRHVAAVLCHRAAAPPAGQAAAMLGHAKEHLQAESVTAALSPLANRPGWQRVAYGVPGAAPLVSVIIPTRDHPDLLRTCVDGLLNQTDYRRIELLIMDNGSQDPEALALLADLARDARIRVLRRPGPFNWSALNNDGANQAVGEILLLLNNDIAVLRPDWLGALVAHALQPGVGAVGAKLLYQDGRVQHGGMTTGKRGTPRHLLRFAGAADPGPYGLLAMAHSVWSVTGACLAVRRDLFFQVGGLNEGLPVAYNDVELCLRLTAEGYRNVWTPLAVLEHRELASRPPDHLGHRRDESARELERLHRDWGSLVFHDPYLSPHFDMTRDHLHFHRTRMPQRSA